MTDPDLSRRLAALASPTRSGAPKRRRHPAGNSRIIAAGVSATALFSLIAVLTLSSPSPGAAVAQPVATTTPPPAKEVVVIVHRPVYVPVAVGPAASPGGTRSPSTQSRTGTGSASSPVQTTAAPSAAPAAVSTPSAPPARPAPVTTTKTS